MPEREKDSPFIRSQVRSWGGRVVLAQTLRARRPWPRCCGRLLGSWRLPRPWC